MNIFLRGQKYVIRGIICNYKIPNCAFQQISGSKKKGNENKIGGSQQSKQCLFEDRDELTHLNIEDRMESEEWLRSYRYFSY